MKRFNFLIVPILMWSVCCNRYTLPLQPIEDDDIVYILTPPEQGDVYITGTVDGKAVLWKNGDVQYLSNTTCEPGSLSVFVSGNDEYVAGYEFIKYKEVATVWKNGVAQRLASEADRTLGNSIYISGEDVYVVGHEWTQQFMQVAKFWKNGVAQKLTDETVDSYANSIFVVE